MRRSTVRWAQYCARGRRFALPLLMALALLWVASPLLLGQRLNSRAAAYKRMNNLQMQQTCRRHLQILSIAFMQYTVDNDGHLPAFDAPEKLRKQLIAYRISAGNLVCPYSDKDYAVNKKLAGKKLKEVPNPDKTLLMWSTKPSPEGYYFALDASGKAKRVSSGELSKLKSSSRL